MTAHMDAVTGLAIDPHGLYVLSGSESFLLSQSLPPSFVAPLFLSLSILHLSFLSLSFSCSLSFLSFSPHSFPIRQVMMALYVSGAWKQRLVSRRSPLIGRDLMSQYTM